MKYLMYTSVLCNKIMNYEMVKLTNVDVSVKLQCFATNKHTGKADVARMKSIIV